MLKAALAGAFASVSRCLLVGGLMLLTFLTFSGATAWAANSAAPAATASTIPLRADAATAGKPSGKAADPSGKTVEASKLESSDVPAGAGGLAATLGLVWLAAVLGLGPDAAVWLMLPIALLLGVGLWTGLCNRPGKKWFAAGPELSFDGSRGVSGGALHQARDYNPQNVGNDASARPWENHSSFQASRFSDTQSEPAADPSAPGWGVPAGFDSAAFLDASKSNFIQLQAAWDRADIPSLRAMMTDDMVSQIQSQLVERERHSPGVANVTEVIMLQAHLLGVEEGESAYVASVEFSGLIRENVSAGPSPFREVWNITRPKTGPSGWLVAGVQALQ